MKVLTLMIPAEDFFDARHLSKEATDLHMIPVEDFLMPDTLAKKQLTFI